jgi:large subunit ribosomal protein L19e
MDLNQIRRMAGDLLGVGQTRVWLDPEQRDRIKEAMTKEDVRGLIAERVVRKKPSSSQSRARARVLKEKKKKGRKRGRGKRKGTAKSRLEKKKTWINKVRAQRRVLKEIKDKEPEAFKEINYRSVYRKITGGYYKGKKYVQAAVKGEK